ncbi:hypothetical protein D5E87_22200 [Vibrio parahaemolyticus]|uniref:Uncharacterized protein n=2 Tax=Vibrio harveyi group TaxID=717610 RepID=A0A7Y4B6A5_VIBAL|nr:MULTISPECIES: hypothetical protein [Vibrio harveyi group]AHJ02766.1 hypothetical protein VPUCM_p0089 [Vibrio parahaemolyticus UCM-V493]EGQ8101337.1 hypothetical protein [Vibrio parahaemolyticus]EGQ8229600.1 hypothetical protein [Vibrio parahaemolyticus]EGQ8329884.1 hypothetical protein [Vibrio parahaemolyticus]EGQ8551825.1 hypothetical protein [Vibrio parahaemolyticus]
MLVCLVKEARNDVHNYNIYLANDNQLIGEVSVSDELVFSSGMSNEMRILTVAHLMKIEERLVRTFSKRFTGEMLDKKAFDSWEYKKTAILGCIRRWKRLSSWFNHMISEASNEESLFVFSNLPTGTKSAKDQQLMATLVLSGKEIDEELVDLRDWLVEEK